MSPRQQPSLTELKVGIFVVVACAILAMAIFAIGSQVGLFEEQFLALTYLSNVSGLKPGDVVLLGGVEVGNVTRVEISKPGELPQTTTNAETLQEVARLMDNLDQSQAQARETETQLQEIRSQYRAAVDQSGTNAPSTQKLRARMDELQEQFRSQQDEIRSIRNEIDQERAGLQNIEVEMRINEEYRDWIRSDSQISLGSIGLLGDKYIEISLGRTDEPPLTVQRSVEGWISSSTEQAVLITGTQQASFAELITGANDILANFKTLSDQVQSIMGSFEAGQGTVGKFITDPSFYNNLNSTVENANQAMERISDLVGNVGEGEGTLSKLLKDDQLYNRLLSTVENVENLTGKINTGEGTLGKLVNDRSVYDKVDKLIANLDEITARLNRGEGTLGKLAKDEQFYNSLQSTVDELSAILKDFRAGKGTLGKLATDDALYSNLNEVSSEVVKLIYDFRQDPKKFLTIKFELF